MREPDRIAATAHGLVGGNRVLFATTGTLPGGLSVTTNYLVTNVTANDFQVAVEGTVVDLTDAGAGTHTVRPTLYWPTGVSVTNTFSVPITDDFAKESDERFLIQLSGAASSNRCDCDR